jgi:hypothetical protein
MSKLRIDDRWLDRLGLLLLAATVVVTAVLATARPAYNWDMLPYAALASETAAMDAVARHDEAYRLVGAAAPAADWALLTQASEYRIEQFADADAFDSQLGMYRIKPAYILASRTLARWMPAIDAFRLLNLIALAVLLTATAWWMIRGGFGRMAFLAAPAFMLAALPEAARIVTPDLLCAAFALSGLALLRNGRWIEAAACFGAATATRPDFAVFPAALLAVSLLLHSERKEAAACLAVSAAGYALAMLSGDHPGWWPHFSASLIGRLGDLANAPPFTVEAYTGAIGRGLFLNATTQNWPWLALLLSGAWLALLDRPVHRLRQPDVLFLALIASLAARCVIFPEPADRVYMPTIMMLAMLVAERWGVQMAVVHDSKASDRPAP